MIDKLIGKLIDAIDRAQRSERTTPTRTELVVATALIVGFPVFVWFVS